MLKVAEVISNGMVLQQGKPICIWGVASDIEAVRVLFLEQEYVVKVIEGAWKVYLDPCKAGGPFTMRIFTNKEKIVLQDILIGEVFLAGGQSNMTFCNLWEANWEREQKVCENDAIRVFSVPKITYQKAEYRHATWQKTSAETARDFSAVAYYAAKKLHEVLQVPVGIISCEWGGTGIKAWMDESYMLRDEELKVHYDSYIELLETLDLTDYDAIFDAYEQTAEDVEKLLYDPKTIKKMGLYEFMRCPLHGLFPMTPEGPKMQKRPGGLYHSMVETVIPYTINSVIWYQGEGNTGPQDIIGYKKKILALMENWRTVFENPDLFFCIVQLSAFGKGEPLENPSWPVVREIQRRLCKEEPHTALAISADFGEMDNIHPVHKKEVGTRCGNALLQNLYGVEVGYKVLEPLVVRCINGSIEITFEEELEVKYIPILFKIYDELGDDEVVKPSYYGNKIIFEDYQMINPKRISYGWMNGVLLGLYDANGNAVTPFMEEII